MRFINVWMFGWVLRVKLQNKKLPTAAAAGKVIKRRKGGDA